MFRIIFGTIALVIALICAFIAFRPDRTESPSTPKSVDLWKVDSIAYRYWGSPVSPYRDEGRYMPKGNATFGIRRETICRRTGSSDMT